MAPVVEQRPWWRWPPWSTQAADVDAAANPAPVSYVPIDFSSAGVMEAEPFAADPPLRERGKFVLPADLGTFWGLLVLGLAYVHHSTTGFALPALLPLINQDLALSDSQGALLTVGYTVRHTVCLMLLALATYRCSVPYEPRSARPNTVCRCLRVS